MPFLLYPELIIRHYFTVLGLDRTFRSTKIDSSVVFLGIFSIKMEKIESRLGDMSIISNDSQPAETKWGWSLMDLYRNALSFYKGMDLGNLQQLQKVPHYLKC